jgi:hypothetical protein
MSNQRNNLFSTLNIETIKKFLYQTQNEPPKADNKGERMKTEESKEDIRVFSEMKCKKPIIPKLNFDKIQKSRQGSLNHSSLAIGGGADY